MADHLAPDDILDRLFKWESLRGSAVPMADAAALSKLQEAGLSEADRNEKLDRLTVNGEKASLRVLAGYTDLHALDRLAEADLGIDLTRNRRAGNLRAVLQAAEIAILNTRDLAGRVARDIEDGKFGDAEEKYRWISSFQETLYSLFTLAEKLPGWDKGYCIRISDSPSGGACLADLRILHETIAKAGMINPDQIGGHDIHEASRNITHQAFVDSTYTNLWASQTVNVPGVQPGAEEDAKAFYIRLVGTEALDLAVNEIDQTGDNFLRQFRAYHQMSEILVSQANRLIADSIRALLSPDGDVLRALDDMHIVLAMLAVVNRNVVPILRNLSVNRYQDIRGSLGITSGSHSPNIKQGLFAPLYELFCAAVKSCAMDKRPFGEEELAAGLQRIVSDPAQDRATHDKYELLCRANQLHLAIRTWRDLHMQYVKTQIGLPPQEATPTASISGSPNAMRAAHGMRQGAHGAYDPIVPIYEALLGKAFPAVEPFASVFREQGSTDNFVDQMLVNTACVVEARSAGVQMRIHGGNSTDALPSDIRED